MSKDDVIEVGGVVEETLRNAVFQVRLENGHVILAHIAGKLRMNNIQVLQGDERTARYYAARPCTAFVAYAAKLLEEYFASRQQ